MMDPDNRQPPPPSRRYSLSVDEAVLRFSEAGVPRSPRSVRRYCERGHLEATLADGVQGEKYLIDPESIERRIEELRQQEVVSRRDRKGPDATGPDQPGPDKTGADRAAPEDVRALEAEILDLRITNRAKDYLLEQLKEERESLLGQVATQSHRIGELETRLELQAGVSLDQLAAPHDSNAREHPTKVSKKPSDSATTPSGQPPADHETHEATNEPRTPAEQ